MKPKGRHNHKRIKKMKPISEIVTEAQALATVTEDQFEASLATLVADLQAFAAGTTPVAPTITSVVVNFSDNSTSEFDPKA
jgi:hypothetical protein